MVELIPLDTEAKKLNAIRARVWYKRFRDLIEVVKRNDTEATMKAFYKLMDEVHGFGYANVAYSAQESLELVLKEEDFWHAD